MKKIRDLCRRLTVRLVLAICLAIIPVNILCVVVTQLIQSNARKTLREVYQRELDFCAAEINKDLERIQRLFIASYDEQKTSVRQQTDSGVKKELFIQNCCAELSTMRKEEAIVDLIYLKDNAENRVYVGYDTFQYDYYFEAMAKRELESLDLFDVKYLNYQIIEIDGSCFILENITYYDYSMGCLFSLDDLLEMIGTEADRENRRLYLADQEGTLLAAYGEGILTEDGTAAGQEALSGQEAPSGQALMAELSVPRFYIVEYVPDSMISYAVPILYRILCWVALCSVLVIPVLWIYIRKQVIRPLLVVENSLRQIESDHLDYRIGEQASTKEFQYLYDAYNRMAESLKNLTIEAYEHEVEKARLDAINSRLQVNPHMLLNSFNMLYSLALSKDFQCIQDYAKNLMKYFRYILRKDQNLVTIAEEIEFVSNYLNAQRVRYPEAFTSVYQMDEDAEEIRIPPFIIENFVENSIKYGLKPGELIEIIVIIRKEENLLKISILDTGNGMSEEILDKLNRGEVVENATGRHIGVWNCRKRIQMYYGESAVLTISSTPGEGTQVWMELPLDQLREDAGRETQV